MNCHIAQAMPFDIGGSILGVLSIGSRDPDGFRKRQDNFYSLIYFLNLQLSVIQFALTETPRYSQEVIQEQGCHKS
jgi:hypothetical protein